MPFCCQVHGYCPLDYLTARNAQPAAYALDGIRLDIGKTDGYSLHTGVILPPGAPARQRVALIGANPGEKVPERPSPKLPRSRPKIKKEVL